MIDAVSFDTARRLKAAGFPQPEFAGGQSWYDTDAQLFWVKCVETPHIHGEWFGDDHAGFVEQPHGDEMFAPASTDILRHLPGNFRLAFNRDEYDGHFVVWNMADNDEEEIISFHANPAGACAQAWLELSKA